MCVGKRLQSISECARAFGWHLPLGSIELQLSLTLRNQLPAPWARGYLLLTYTREAGGARRRDGRSAERFMCGGVSVV